LTGYQATAKVPRLLLVFAQARGGLPSDETNLSAEPNSSPAGARFSSPYEDACRASDLEASPSQGSEAPGGVDTLEVAVSDPAARFGPADRLLRSREFQYVLRHGRRTTAAQFVVLMVPSQSTPARRRLGITVSKRVGNAVVRNHVKRRIREWFRGSSNLLVEPADVVVIGRPGVGTLGGREVASLLDAAIISTSQARS